MHKSDSMPIVKIRPGKGRRFLDGAPWLFADEIAMDRRTKSLEPGTIVRLQDGEEIRGTAAFNPNSRIVARLMDRDPEAKIDRDWLTARLSTALKFRERLFDRPFYRLVHAEGDGFPGLVIDRFGPAVVVQPNAAWADAFQDELVASVRDVTGAKTIVINGTSRVRKLEGLESKTETIGDLLSGPVEALMNDTTYLADLTGGQKTGLFYDQRPNHSVVKSIARDARVLDVFCHVGGFGLAALSGGATSVSAVDSSAAALVLAEDAANRQGWSGSFKSEKADAFDALAGHDPNDFDIVICDPPAFAPSKDALAAGLRAYERMARLAAPLVKTGGILCLCSCSHAAGLEVFHKACVTGLRKAGRTGALFHAGRAGPDHPVHIGLPEGGYLKALFFRLGST